MRVTETATVLSGKVLYHASYVRIGHGQHVPQLCPVQVIACELQSIHARNAKLTLS